MLEEANEMDNTYFLFTSVRSLPPSSLGLRGLRSGAELS